MKSLIKLTPFDNFPDAKATALGLALLHEKTYIVWGAWGGSDRTDYVVELLGAPGWSEHHTKVMFQADKAAVAAWVKETNHGNSHATDRTV